MTAYLTMHKFYKIQYLTQTGCRNIHTLIINPSKELSIKPTRFHIQQNKRNNKLQNIRYLI